MPSITPRGNSQARLFIGDLIIKKLLLILSIILISNYSYAEKSRQDMGILEYTANGSAMIVAMPIGAFFVSPIMTFASYPFHYHITYKDIQKANKVPILEYPLCSAMHKFYINADEIPMYYAKELDDQSNLEDVKGISKILPKFRFSKEPYMCVNPQKTKIYKNGCLDTIKKNYTKATGKWYLKKAFIYSDIEYIQIEHTLEHGKKITAFTDVMSTLKYAYYNNKKIINKSNPNLNRFSLEYSVIRNCPAKKY